MCNNVDKKSEKVISMPNTPSKRVDRAQNYHGIARFENRTFQFVHSVTQRSVIHLEVVFRIEGILLWGIAHSISVGST